MVALPACVMIYALCDCYLSPFGCFAPLCGCLVSLNSYFPFIIFLICVCRFFWRDFMAFCKYFEAFCIFLYVCCADSFQGHFVSIEDIQTQDALGHFLSIYKYLGLFF